MKIEGIKNFKIRTKNVKQFFKKNSKYKLMVGILALLLLLSGCQENRQLATNYNIEYDIIDTTDETLLREGINQTLDVPNEDFKLKVNYKCLLNEGEKWTITGDKQIFSEIYTEGLPEDYEVYVDNVHIDTTIRSIYATIDGITQDSMDDRLHAGLILGFPIADDNKYGNICNIEGQNEKFIEATSQGFNGCFTTTNSTEIRIDGVETTYVHLDERRRTEEEYLWGGVYANKIDAVIDLIIVKPKKELVQKEDENGNKLYDEDGKPVMVEVQVYDKEGKPVYIRTVTAVKSIVEVSVWPYVAYRDKNNNEFYKYFFIDKHTGKVIGTALSREEYRLQTGISTKKLTK